MRWTVHSEKPLYADQRLDIRLADVGITGGRHLAHRVIRSAPGAGAVVLDGQGRVLPLWRHRFITQPLPGRARTFIADPPGSRRKRRG